MFATSDLDSGTIVVTPVAALAQEFVTNGGTSSLVVVAPPGVHAPLFALDDILRIAAPGFVDPAEATAAVQYPHKFWLPGGLPQATPCDVWLKVLDVADEDTRFTYTVAHLHGPNCRFDQGTVVVRYGQADAQRIVLSSVLDGAPFIDIIAIGEEPWNDSPRKLRVGNLEPVSPGSGMGLLAGDSATDETLPFALLSNVASRLNRTPLSLTTGATAAASITPEGDLRVGVDVAQEEGTAFHVDAPGDLVTIRAKVNLFAELRSQGAIALTSAGKITLLATPDGAVKIGPDVDEASTTHIHYDVASGRLTLRTSTTEVTGTLDVRGTLETRSSAAVTARLAHDGTFKLGPDVDAVDGVRVQYDPTDESLRVTGDLHAAAGMESGGPITVGTDAGTSIQLNPDGSARVDGRLDFSHAHGSDRITLGAGDNITAELRADGTVKLGANVAESNGTHIQYEAAGGKLFISAGTTHSAPVTMRGGLRVGRNVAPRIILDEDGSVRFGTDATTAAGTDFLYSTSDRRVLIQAPVVLAQGLSVAGNVVLNSDGAFVFGQDERIRIDKNGIQMRLLPAGENSINVLAMGRAARIHAYQTVDSTQAVDLLAYFNSKVPNLHGRNTLGVADVQGGEPDLYLRLTRYYTGARNAELRASFVDIEAERIHLRGNVTARAGFEFSGTGDASRVFRLRNLPTDPRGLPSGAVWNSGGTLKIVL